MPCNTVQTNTVELGKITAFDLLEKALKEEFGHASRHGSDRFMFAVDGRAVQLQGGRATSTLPRERLEVVVGRVKQAYSRESVKFAAKRFGWAVEKGADPNNFYIRKG